MNKKGFTLVELLAVIAILAILVIIALPNVLKMYNEARRNTFVAEANNIINTAKKQYFLDGMGAKNYSNSGTNKLSLSGGNNIEYCISLNGNGEIINLQVYNGTYKYVSNGIVSDVKNNEVEDVESGYTFECSGPIKYVNRQNEGQITVGDEVRIGSEHFYVINSDDGEGRTILLAKYNLLVGDVYNKANNIWSKTKTLRESDTGYGLQSETAKGHYNGCTDRTGVVAFSGISYWDNANCVSTGSSGYSCPDTSGLKSNYSNSANASGTTSYKAPYPYVYNSSMSTIAPSVATYINESNTQGYAENNGYNIAYYVERYINNLKRLGAPNNITGRLLTYEEAGSLSNTIKGNWSYWVGFAQDQLRVCYYRNSILRCADPWSSYGIGLRPVITVSTSDI
ncbi:MAG: prepilin-type N-terminal cleavage/methylation domain-containing protein [Bacilli bacterium]|nr:prepilin-type N-terminal cleavage/methylation domain-containing protein [Bacilli bacterium]